MNLIQFLCCFCVQWYRQVKKKKRQVKIFAGFHVPNILPLSYLYLIYFVLPVYEGLIMAEFRRIDKYISLFSTIPYIELIICIINVLII